MTSASHLTVRGLVVEDRHRWSRGPARRSQAMAAGGLAFLAFFCLVALAVLTTMAGVAALVLTLDAMNGSLLSVVLRR